MMSKRVALVCLGSRDRGHLCLFAALYTTKKKEAVSTRKNGSQKKGENVFCLVDDPAVRLLRLVYRFSMLFSAEMAGSPYVDISAIYEGVRG